MKYGICTKESSAAEYLAAGFDYVELSASEMSAKDPFDPAAYEGLKVEATNLFFPGGISIWQEFAVAPYAMTTASRAESIGVQIMVIGSGRQRQYPGDATWPAEIGKVDLLEFLSATANPTEGFAKMVGYLQTGPTSIIFAPESLNRTETNVGNDCGELARLLATYGANYTADSYHILYEWNANGREDGREFPSEAFWADQLPHLPAHVHLGDLDRKFPTENDPMIRGFFDRLKELGYNGRVSLECSTEGVTTQEILQTLGHLSR